MTAPKPLYQEGYLMTDTTDQQAVTVAQEDREAAALLVPLCFGASKQWQENVRAGFYDDGEIVQAFARHRLASVSSASAEGFVLVPREPTVAMIEAARGMFPAPAYRAMLAASPEPVPATNQAGEVEEATRRALDALTWANEKLRECGKQVDFSLGMCVTLSDSEKRAEALRVALAEGQAA